MHVFRSCQIQPDQDFAYRTPVSSLLLLQGERKLLWFRLAAFDKQSPYFSAHRAVLVFREAR